MKLAVSNIAWRAEEDERVLELLRGYGVRGIEVAPTRVWPDWRGADGDSARRLRSELEAGGFSVPALQAILYGRPGLSIFARRDERSDLLEHLRLVVEVASGLGARALVFGSPDHRVLGGLDPDVAYARARDCLSELAGLCAARGTTLCIEPMPPAYGGEFLTGWREVLRIVREIDDPGVGLHFDTACVTLAGDDPAAAVGECAAFIRHFHVSEPALADFSTPVVRHREIGRELARNGYAGWLSIEMRRTDDPLASIGRAVERVLEWYAR